MKKIYVFAFLIMLSLTMQAQVQQNHADAVKFDFSVGLSSSYCDQDYKVGQYGIEIGLDMKKPILHFPNEASTIYGLAGIHLVMRGGNGSCDFFTSLDDRIQATHLQIPLHAGFCYQFSKVAFFLDLGPYFAYKVKNAEDNLTGYRLSDTEFGVGTYAGVKFNKFAIGVGTDYGLTSFAVYESNDNYKLKNTVTHIDLRWTF